jgi:uncharacterized hydrophobic protein (TIGR00271 family)
VLQIRIATPAFLTDSVIEVLEGADTVSSLSVIRRASLRPEGDIVQADIAREAANEVIDRLRELRVPEHGTIHIEPVRTWLSRRGFEADRRAPGSGADAVVWADVTQRAYEDSELNWTFITFMTLATLIAAIAIVIDSQILVIGAMVLGPEFGAVAALGLALVRRRYTLLALATSSLFLGFFVAIAVTTMGALVARALGWVTITDVTGPRPGTEFIYSPDKWSFIVALIAGAAGVLSLTSAKVGGLSGVFISVTTIPAAGNIGLGVATGADHEIWGSSAQLLLNLSGMAVAGCLTLAVQSAIWSRITVYRSKLGRRVDESEHG